MHIYMNKTTFLQSIFGDLWQKLPLALMPAEFTTPLSDVNIAAFAENRSQKSHFMAFPDCSLQLYYICFVNTASKLSATYAYRSYIVIVTVVSLFKASLLLRVDRLRGNSHTVRLARRAWVGHSWPRSNPSVCVSPVASLCPPEITNRLPRSTQQHHTRSQAPYYTLVYSRTIRPSVNGHCNNGFHFPLIMHSGKVCYVPRAVTM